MADFSFVITENLDGELEMFPVSYALPKGALVVACYKAGDLRQEPFAVVFDNGEYTSVAEAADALLETLPEAIQPWVANELTAQVWAVDHSWCPFAS
mgnify:CR=1 FL=1